MGPITTDLRQTSAPASPGAAFSLGTNFRGCRPYTLQSANGAQHRRGSSRVPLRRLGTAQVLVARSVGVVSAASRAISSVGSISSDGSSADTYCDSTAYGCSTIDTSSINGSAVDATAIDARATNAGAIREGVS